MPRRSPRRHIRHPHLRRTKEDIIKVKQHPVGKGWRGDSIRHSLASRGLLKKYEDVYSNQELSERLLNFVKKKGIPMTANEISQETGLARPTVVKYLEELEREEEVKPIKMGDRTYWKAK